jgi:hypothetical protein
MPLMPRPGTRRNEIGGTGGTANESCMFRAKNMLTKGGYRVVWTFLELCDIEN